ncbi:MAG: Hsp70 family protein, partial [Micromonosporaceae bacterium]|nr:Hsp70 family protein [Micromonosporaceae bacterium]
MAGLRLGIDVGTSNTVAMLQRPDGSVRPLLFDGSPLLPSAVYPDEHGEVQVGRAALRAARLDPARLEPNPKRRVDEGAVLLGERPWPVHQLLGALLRRVRGEAVRIAGSAPSSLVLTVPASWAAPRRSVLADAAREAGMPEPELVPEPVAAAAHFAGTLDRPAVDGECLVVYDLGAGTFDVAAVAREAGGYRVLAADGLTDLGGLDLDQLVVDHVGRLVASHDAALWQRLTQPADGLWRRRFRDLWDECRAAKEALSSTSSTMVLVPGWDREVLVTRTEFERAASGLLARTVQLTESVMDVAGVDRHRLTVLLVGGGTRVPLVATLLHRALHLPPVVLDQPELVVAEGALRAPAMRAPVHAGVPEAVTAAEAVPGPAPEPAPEAVPAPTVVPEPAPEPETVPLAGVEPAEAVNGLDPVRRPGRD